MQKPLPIISFSSDDSRSRYQSSTSDKLRYNRARLANISDKPYAKNRQPYVQSNDEAEGKPHSSLGGIASKLRIFAYSMQRKIENSFSCGKAKETRT